jgi:hypothetical protein
MDSTGNTAENLAPLKAGESWGFYKIVECSPLRVLLRADYTSGLLLLVLGAVFLLLDVIVFAKMDFIVRMVRGARGLYTARDFLHGLPTAFKGAMLVLPVIGVGWFFFMTGRSIVLDFTRMVGRKVKCFFLGPEADLRSVTALQWRINAEYTPTRGDSVCLHLLDAQGRSLMAQPDETASEDEFDSTPITDFAKLLSLGAHVAGVLRLPITMQGEPAKMSASNRKLLEAVRTRAST